MKKTAIIVKGEWTRNDTIVFVAKKGYYPCDYSGDIDGFFVAEEVVEQGETPVINDEEEVTFFKNKYSQFVERVDVQID